MWIDGQDVFSGDTVTFQYLCRRSLGVYTVSKYRGIVTREIMLLARDNYLEVDIHQQDEVKSRGKVVFRVGYIVQNSLSVGR